MTTGMRHLLVIDTASRMAHQIINRRRVEPPVFLAYMDGPEEVERLRCGGQSSRVFDWMREEILLEAGRTCCKATSNNKH